MYFYGGTRRQTEVGNLQQSHGHCCPRVVPSHTASGLALGDQCNTEKIRLVLKSAASSWTQIFLFTLSCGEEGRQHQPTSHVSGLPCESNLQVQSSLQMGAGLAASDHSLVRDSEPEPSSHTAPEHEPQRNEEGEREIITVLSH